MKFLFVGERDTGRGPLARALFEKICLGDPAVSLVSASAGVTATLGLPPAPAVAAIAREAGLSLRPGGARLLSRESLVDAEMILCMEQRHRSAVIVIQPDSEPRCRLLGQYRSEPSAGDAGDRIAPVDPVDMQGYRRALASLEDCLRGLHSAMARPAEEVYTQEIERHVRALRDSPPLLSPREVDLIDRWWRNGVPLWLAIDSIRSAFRRAGPDRARTLLYCAKDVAERMGTLARDERVGPGPGSAGPERRTRFVPLERMRASGFPRAASLLDRLVRDAERGCAAPEGGTGLNARAMEAAIASALREEAPGEDLFSLRSLAEERLVAYRERMTREAWETTVARHIDRALRERAGLSDFSFPALLEPERDPP